MAEPLASTTSSPQLPTDRVPLVHVRSRLATVWLTAAALVFGLLILQSLLGKYGDRAQQVWSWVLPTMMPTLTLMLSALGADALSPEPAGSYVKKSFFLIAFWLSLPTSPSFS